MTVEHTDIPGILIFIPKIYQDSRGYFFESFQKETFSKAGVSGEFVQDNQSLSAKNVLRGMHFQLPPFAQGKLVRVIKGAVLDIAVDLRKNSTTYGKYCSVELNELNNKMMWIPEGFAHGFLSLVNDSIFQYKCTQFYHQASEVCIRWDDPTLNIDWGTLHPIISEKDQSGQLFENFVSPF
jgi:dTDP-4-dehydrorhamnose 3,5-epimerase